MTEECGGGNVVLSHDDWRAVMAALEGDESQRNGAFDALQRWAPRPWLEELDEQEERMRTATASADPHVAVPTEGAGHGNMEAVR